MENVEIEKVGHIYGSTKTTQRRTKYIREKK